MSPVKKSQPTRYQHICSELLEEMEANHDSGDRLPSEQVLAQRFGVNRHTVRRAIDELVLMGLIERRHGKGIFVLEKPSNGSSDQLFSSSVFTSNQYSGVDVTEPMD